jgi:hypothetical protein
VLGIGSTLGTEGPSNEIVVVVDDDDDDVDDSILL